MPKPNASISDAIASMKDLSESMKTSEEKIARNAQNRVEGLDTKSITSDMGKIIKEFSESTFKSIGSGNKLSSAEISAQQFQIKQMRNLVKNTDNKEEREQLENMLSLQTKLVKENKSQNSLIVDTFTKHLDVLSGTIIGVFSESPLLGLIAAGAIDQTKRYFDNKKEQKAAIRKQTDALTDKLAGISDIAKEDILSKNSQADKDIEINREKKVQTKKRDGVFTSMDKSLKSMVSCCRTGVDVSKDIADDSAIPEILAAAGGAKLIKLLSKVVPGAALASTVGGTTSDKVKPSKSRGKAGLVVGGLKKLVKVAAKLGPLALAGALLWNGADMINEYKEKGSIYDSFSNMLSDMSFGLVEADKIKSFLKAFSFTDALKDFGNGMKSAFSEIAKFSKIFGEEAKTQTAEAIKAIATSTAGMIDDWAAIIHSSFINQGKKGGITYEALKKDMEGYIEEKNSVARDLQKNTIDALVKSGVFKEGQTTFERGNGSQQRAMIEERMRQQALIDKKKADQQKLNITEDRSWFGEWLFNREDQFEKNKKYLRSLNKEDYSYGESKKKEADSSTVVVDSSASGSFNKTSSNMTVNNTIIERPIPTY